VAQAVETVAKTLNVSAPDDDDVGEFMTQAKTQYLTALEILNQENFNIDFPVPNSDDVDELSNYSASMDGYGDNESQSQSQSVISNAKTLLRNGTGIYLSNKSIGSISISSKDLGSKNPSINSIKWSDEEHERRITPKTNQTLNNELFQNDEIHSIEMSSPRVITPHSANSKSVSSGSDGGTPHLQSDHHQSYPAAEVGGAERDDNGPHLSFQLDRNPLEKSLSDLEADDEFDENGVTLTFSEPFDPKVNKADLKYSIATNFSEIEGLLLIPFVCSPDRCCVVCCVELAHFARYALGIYSTLIYLYMNPCCGICKLCHFCSCIHPMGHCNPILQCCDTNTNHPQHETNKTYGRSVLLSVVITLLLVFPHSLFSQCSCRD
jgi:hypothetical protein